MLVPCLGKPIDLGLDVIMLVSELLDIGLELVPPIWAQLGCHNPSVLFIKGFDDRLHDQRMILLRL